MFDDARSFLETNPVLPDGTPDFKSLWAAYRTQKGNAKHRGIPWKFDFSGWLAVWIESGKLKQRGLGGDRYCMSRYADQGAYEAGNVFIQTCAQNVAQGVVLANLIKQEKTFDAEQSGGPVGGTVAWLNSCFKTHARRTIMHAASMPPGSVKRGEVNA